MLLTYETICSGQNKQDFKLKKVVPAVFNSTRYGLQIGLPTMKNKQNKEEYRRNFRKHLVLRSIS